jgi:putative zinc finger protein
MTCEMLDYVAAYVLDALEPDESARLQRHLATCDVCRAELANVEWIPKLLPLVELDDLERLEDAAPEPEPAAPPPALLDRLIADATHEMRGPRGRRTAALVGAAALLLGAGGLAAVNDLQSTGAHHAKPPATAEATDPRTHVSAQVTLSGRSWGTQLGLTITGAYPGGTCSLVARSDDGRTDTAATWVASSAGTAHVPGATAIPAGHLRELDVVTLTGYQLVRIVLPHQ